MTWVQHTSCLRAEPTLRPRGRSLVPPSCSGRGAAFQGAGGLCALSTSWPVLSGTRWRSLWVWGWGPGLPVPYTPRFTGPLFLQLQIWDTAGQERFRTITQSYYRSANGAILAYDITKRSSFLSVPHWIEDVRKYAGSSIVQLLIGEAGHGRLSVSFVNEGWAGLGQAGAEPGPGRNLEGAVAAGRL